MSQPTDLKQTTPTSTKRNIAVPSAPKKKKSRRNVTENPQMMFDNWLNQFKEMNSMYTNVDLSLHASQSGKPNNFVMLSQNPSGQDQNVIQSQYTTSTYLLC